MRGSRDVAEDAQEGTRRDYGRNLVASIRPSIMRQLLDVHGLGHQPQRHAVLQVLERHAIEIHGAQHQTARIVLEGLVDEGVSKPSDLLEKLGGNL